MRPYGTRERGTCPVCRKSGLWLRSDGLTLGSHSAPKWIYRDGSACLGTGLRCVEGRVRPYRGRVYPTQAEVLERWSKGRPPG